MTNFLKNLFILSLFSCLSAKAQETMEAYAYHTLYASGYVEPNDKVKTGSMYEIGNGANVGYVTFDLSTIPENAIIESAYVHLTRQGGTATAGTTGEGKLTLLTHKTFEIKPTRNEIFSGDVIATGLDWTASVPPIIGILNERGMEVLKKRKGSYISMGVVPPTTTPNKKNIAGYNSTTLSAPAPKIVITYEEGEPPKPTSDFVASNTTPYALDTISFTDQTGNYPDSWLWDFGDGNTSTLRHPSHNYADTGLYTVTLTATNEQGSDTKTKTDYIQVFERPPAPAVEFYASQTFAEVSEIIAFTDSSKNDPNQWLWDFGDGGVSTEQHPVYSYPTSGIYTVKLIATNDVGSDTLVKEDFIQIGIVGLAPEAYYGSEISNLTVEFTDSSQNNPTQWAWDFDADNPGVFLSQDQNPTFSYDEEGTYRVCLTAINANGESTYCNSISVTAPEVPVADFSFASVDSRTIQFTDLSTNQPNSWNWNFGDGESSTEQHPTHIFQSEGNYTVSLVAGNNAGGTSITKTVVVQVTSALSASENKLDFYPNPASNKLVIKNINAGHLRILNSTGKEVFNKEFDNNHINLESLPQGVYYMIVNGNSKGKLIIQK